MSELARRPFLLLGMAVLLAYAVTRLLLFWRFPAFWDEGTYAVQAQTGLDDPATRFSELADGHRPLFVWLATLLVDQGIRPLAAVRLVSLIAGVFTLSAVALIARRLGGATVAVVACALYVASPIFLVHDVHGLIDPLLAALMAGALYLEIKQAENPRLDRAFGLGLVMGAALLTREVGILAILLLPFSLLCFEWSGATSMRRLAHWAGCSLVSVALATACHAILLLSPTYYEAERLRKTTVLARQYRPIADALADPFKYVADVWPATRDAFAGYVTIPLLAVAAGAILVAARRRHRLGLLLTLWALAPIAVVMLLTQSGFPRYFVMPVSVLSVLVAWGLVGVARWLNENVKWFTPYRAATVVSMALVPSVVFDANVIDHPGTARYPGIDNHAFAAGWSAGTGLNVIGDALDRLAGPGKTVVAATQFTPWNLVVRFDHPRRVPLGGPIPYQDGAVATSRGRTIYFLPYGVAGSRGARFLLVHSSLALPRGLDLAHWRLVASYRRPPPTTVGGRHERTTVVELYERG